MNEPKKERGSNAAISLLDKYSSINSGIESARTQTQRTSSEIDDFKTQIRHLVDVKRPEMRKKIEKTRDEMRDFNAKEIPQIKSRLNSLKKEYEYFSTNKITLERQTKITEEYTNTRKLKFLQSSKHFREIWNKKMKLQSGKNANSVLFSWSNEMIDNDINNSSDESENESLSYEDFDLFSQEEISNYRIHKLNERRKLKASDIEINQARQNTRVSLKNKTQAEFGLSNALLDLEKAEVRTKARREKLFLQQSQLERIKQDVIQLEEKIERMKSQTDEANSMAKAYALDASRRRKNSNNNAREDNKKPLNNPYKTPSNISKKSTTSAFASSTSTLITPSPRYISNHKPVKSHEWAFKSYMRNDSTSKTAHLNIQEASNEYSATNSNHGSIQYPHREGRIRVDKQFSTALEIPIDEGNDDEDDDELLHYVAFRKHNKPSI